MEPGRGGNWVGQWWPGVALLRLLGEGREGILKAETSPPGAFRPLWHWHWPRLRILVLGVGGRKLHINILTAINLDTSSNSTRSAFHTEVIRYFYALSMRQLWARSPFMHEGDYAGMLGQRPAGHYGISWADRTC
jgi:hypothetical protein